VNFVLDASVALSWLLEDAGAGQSYADAVFDVLKFPGAQALVPVTWGLEIANVIAKTEAQGILLANRTQGFLATVDAAPIVCDTQTYAAVFSDTLQLSRRFQLSSYDASYLELALRSALPLSTLDKDLRKAATRAGVKVFKPE
jgi:predicted nucleic acid-binding protein